MLKLVQDKLIVLLNVLDALLLDVSHMKAQILFDKPDHFDLDNETSRGYNIQDTWDFPRLPIYLRLVLSVQILGGLENERTNSASLLGIELSRARYNRHRNGQHNRYSSKKSHGCFLWQKQELYSNEMPTKMKSKPVLYSLLRKKEIVFDLNIRNFSFQTHKELEDCVHTRNSKPEATR